MLNITEIIENNNDIEVIPENLDVSYFNKIFNISVKSILSIEKNSINNFDTNKILIDLLNKKVGKNNKNYNISSEIISSLESGKSLDDSLDTIEKMELYEIMKIYYLGINTDKLLKYRGFLGKDFVSLLTNVCNHNFFQETDIMAFDCDMGKEELEEYVMYMDSIDEINTSFKELEDLFVKDIISKMPFIINRIKKDPKRANKIINEFPDKLSDTFSSVRKNTISYLNSFLTRLEDSLIVLYYFFLFKGLGENGLDNVYKELCSYINKHVLMSVRLYEYVCKCDDFRSNIEKQYQKIPELENINIYDLEKKVREQGILKKIKPQVINIGELSLKIIAHDGYKINDNYSHLFTVGINFDGENKFGLYRATDINFMLVSNIQTLSNSLFVTINSYGEVSVGGTKKSLDFLKGYDLKLRKIILYVVLEYLNVQEEFLESFFLNDSDFGKYIINKSFENEDLENVEDFDTDKVEDLDIDENEDIRNLYNESENIDEKNKNRIREAFLTVKGYPVDKIFNKFVKILGKPVRESNGSHFTFYSSRTGKRYVFAKHGSRGTNNIGEGLLKKYFINYGICPTELI